MLIAIASLELMGILIQLAKLTAVMVVEIILLTLTSPATATVATAVQQIITA